MKKRLILLLPLLVPFILSLLPLLLLFLENTQRRALEQDVELMEWHRLAMDRIENLKADFSYLAQMDLFQYRYQELLQKRLARQPESRIALSPELLVSAFQKTFPESHRPPAPMFYGFTMNPSGEPDILKGKGLQTRKKNIILKLFSSMIRYDSLAPGDLKTYDKLTSSVFGEFCRLEFLALQRRGLITPIKFEEKDSFLLWNTVVFNKKLLGGYFILFPRPGTLKEIEGKSLRYALKKVAKPGKYGMSVMLMPIEGAESDLKAIVPRALAGNPNVAKLVHLARTCGNREKALPLGQLCEPVIGLFAVREFFNLDSPFEIWVCSPALDFGGSRLKSIEGAALGLLLTGWVLLLIRILSTGKMFEISIRRWLIGFFLLVGCVPVTGLYLVGSLQIETTRLRNIQENIRETMETFEKIDTDSGLLFNKFLDLTQTVFSSQFWIKKMFGGSEPLIREAAQHLFQSFRENRFSPPNIYFHQPGKEPAVLSETGRINQNDRGFSLFHSALVRDTIKYLDPLDDVQFAKVKGSSQHVLRAFYAGGFAGNKVEHQFFIKHGDGDDVQYGNENFYSFYEFVANQRKIVGEATIRVEITPTQLIYLSDYLRSLTLAQPQNLYVGARIVSGGFVPCFPNQGSSFWAAQRPRYLKTFQNLLQVSARTRSAKVLIDHQNSVIMLTYPCLRGKNFLVGACLDFKPIRHQAQAEKLRLILGIALLVIFILVLGISLSRYLIIPLLDVQKALERVAGGDLNYHIGLIREDELGDLTRKFDLMIEGLRTRKELGRFVSNTLDLQVSSGTGENLTGSNRMAGAVLVSDLRNFTTLSETFPEREIVGMLNHHLGSMAEAIREKNGHIEKFIGDAIIGVFLDENPEISARSAMEAAENMRRRHLKVQEERKQKGLFTYEMGVGIDFGMLLVGTMSSPGRQEWTAIGKPRSNAERLEGFSKKGSHTRIVVSSDFSKLFPERNFEKMEADEVFELRDLGITA